MPNLFLQHSKKTNMMKTINPLLIVLMLFLGSCNGKAQNNKANKAESQKKYSWKANVERLSKKTPLTDAEFAEWYPKRLLDLPATNIKSTANEQMATFTVTYYANKQRLDLNLTDGAGKKGARMIAPGQRIAQQEIDEKMGDGYIITIKRNGIIARETYTPENDTYRLKFMIHQRYFVDIITMNLGRDKTWEAFDALVFDKLKK